MSETRRQAPRPDQDRTGEARKGPWLAFFGVIGAAVITAVGGVVVALIGVGGKADGPGPSPGSEPPASTAMAPRPTGTGKRPSTPIAAQVAWTDDGGSTLLRAYDGPDSHNSVGAYPAAEHLTVTCVKNGRAVQVGAAYHGPNPNDTRWYRLAGNDGWVPAVYVQIDGGRAVPSCS